MKCVNREDYIKNEEDGEIKKFNPDCFLTQCNPQEHIPDILGTGNVNYTYELDKMSHLLYKKIKYP